MAALSSSPDGALEVFESLQIPIPVYRPVKGQLRNKIGFAVEQLKECTTEDSALRLKLGYALLCLDRKFEAAEVFEQVKNIADSHRVRIICCIERGTILGQKPELEAGLKLAEEHPDVFDGDDHLRLHMVERGKYELGRLLLQENNFANAARYLEAGLSFWKDGYEVHRSLGIVYARMKEFSKAEEHLNICIKLKPGDDSYVYYTLGNIDLNCARYQETVQAFVQSATILSKQGDNCLPESQRWWIAGVIAATKCQDYDQAVQYLTLSLKAALKVPVEHELYVARLNEAISWLTKSMQTKVLGVHTALQDSKQEPLKTLQAEGYGTLGIAMFTYQSYDEALELLQRAVNLLTAEDECSRLGDREKLLLFRFQLVKAKIYSRLNENQKALEAFQRCKRVAPTESDRLRCEIRCCFAMKQMGRYIASVARYRELEEEYSALMESEIELKAQMLLGLGECLLHVGNSAEACGRLEVARRLLEDNGRCTSVLLPVVYSMLYVGLVEQCLFTRALELASSFSATALREHRHEQILQIHAACTSRFLLDNKASEAALTRLMELQDMKDQRIKSVAIAALANVYRNQGDYGAAEAKYDEAISILPPGETMLEAQMYSERAGMYMSKAAEAKRNGEQLATTMEINERALQDYDHATKILEGFTDLSQELAGVYTGQALTLLSMQKHEAAGEKLDKAMEIAGDSKLRKAKIKRARAVLLFCHGDHFEQAMVEGKEAALLFAEIQLQLQHLESAWVTLLEGDMKQLFFTLQEAWAFYRKSYVNALLWAERCRLRLYFHLAEQRLVSSDAGGNLLDPLAFDRDDDQARSCIASAVERCGAGCVFVEYSCAPTREMLYIFVIRRQQGLVVDFKEVWLKDIFSDEGYPGNIDALVKRTRTAISQKVEDKAKAGLGALYRLLVKPVWELLAGYETIIFSPAGSVWLVPFAALYDETCSQFLIEKKKIGIVPSLRALRRCQERYDEAQASQAPGSFGFVAGDPEPMGLNWGQLPGARQEATEVAELLRVAPLIGKDMTKQAVIEGLRSESRVISLVTHGVVDAIHPHGALVMQGKRKQEMVDVERLVLLNNFVPRSSSSRLDYDNSEVLTAGEISKLDMHAALVVLSACQTAGEGEVPSEGLLGLARAVLQAGSCCAVVTQWRVDDDATRQLMTGMFVELMSNRQTVVEALRSSMLKLLRLEAPVYKWASAAALGFSLLRIPSTAIDDHTSAPVQCTRAEKSLSAEHVISSRSPSREQHSRRFMCCWKF